MLLVEAATFMCQYGVPCVAFVMMMLVLCQDKVSLLFIKEQLSSIKSSNLEHILRSKTTLDTS